tara:strand:+ start:479 stop:859 length:381 start_codon:yes stop_codon:yes gene_type:complete
MTVKLLKYLVIFLNFLILTTSISYSDDIKRIFSNIENTNNMFSSQSIGELFVYPDLIKNYSLSGMSIVEFYVEDDGKINEIEIVKSLGQPFDDAIFKGLNTFVYQKIIPSTISKGFRYRLPIYFKN